MVSVSYDERFHFFNEIDDSLSKICEISHEASSTSSADSDEDISSSEECAATAASVLNTAPATNCPPLGNQHANFVPISICLNDVHRRTSHSTVIVPSGKADSALNHRSLRSNAADVLTPATSFADSSDKSHSDASLSSNASRPRTDSISQSSSWSSSDRANVHKSCLYFDPTTNSFKGKFSPEKMYPFLTQLEFISILDILNNLSALKSLRKISDKSSKIADMMLKTWICGVGMILMPFCMYYNSRIGQAYEKAYLAIGEIVAKINREIVNENVRLKLLSNGNIGILIRR